MTTTIAVMYFEFYRVDGSWIGAAPAGQVYGDFAKAESVKFEGRVELVTHDEHGDIVE
jgi:hypothetical protein